MCSLSGSTKILWDVSVNPTTWKNSKTLRIKPRQKQQAM